MRQHRLMNGYYCWVGAAFGLELMFVNFENQTVLQNLASKELGVHRRHKLVLFTPH